MESFDYSFRVVVGDYYKNIWSKHQKNENIHTIQGSHLVVLPMFNGGRIEKGKICLICDSVSFIEAQQTMINFEHVKSLFKFLKFAHGPRKH